MVIFPFRLNRVGATQRGHAASVASSLALATAYVRQAGGVNDSQLAWALPRLERCVFLWGMINFFVVGWDQVPEGEKRGVCHHLPYMYACMYTCMYVCTYVYNGHEHAQLSYLFTFVMQIEAFCYGPTELYIGL